MPEPGAIPRRGERRKTFIRQISGAFAATAAMTALIAAVLISAFWNYQFDNYVRDNLQRIADGVAQVAGQAYVRFGGWSLQTLSTVPRFGPTSGVGVQVLNADGTLLYDDVSGSISQQNEQQSEVVIQPGGPVVTSPVVVADQQVGLVRVWAYGPGAVLTERDEQFRRGSFTALFIAALASIVIASMAGSLYAFRLVRPIQRITETARAVRGGDRDARTGLQGEDEIAVLGRTFDDMADAIEADRQMERRLTADVAHELRTPLQAIQATVEAMQDGVLPADEERLGIVRDETVRLGRLADGILELTRLERGSLPFEMKRLDPAVPVRAAVDAHEALFEASGLTWSVDITSGLVVVGDLDRLQQAVSNLLSNAARYTPAGGRVEVDVRREGDRAVIEISDTGIGIAEEDMPRVFSRFWRADDARARSTGGIGIGLAVTKEIVERHAGTIGAERLEEAGTRFVIAIPLAPARPQGTATRAERTSTTR